MYKVLIPESRNWLDCYDINYHAVRFDNEEQAYGFALGALNYIEGVHSKMYSGFRDIYMLDVNTDKLYCATNYKKKAFKGNRSVLSFVWEETVVDDETPAHYYEWVRKWF